MLGGVTENAFLDCKIDVLNLDEAKSAKAVSGGLKALEVGVAIAQTVSPQANKGKKKMKYNVASLAMNIRRESIGYRPLPDAFYSKLTNFN